VRFCPEAVSLQPAYFIAVDHQKRAIIWGEAPATAQPCMRQLSGMLAGSGMQQQCPCQVPAAVIIPSLHMHPSQST
jgi:hypothetical protein